MDEKKELIRDDVFHLPWGTGQVRKCKHPGVVEAYGRAEYAIVPYFKCAKCRFSTHYKYMGATGCGYTAGEALG